MGFLLRALGWGVVIYAVMYLLWSGLVIHGLSVGIVSLLVRIGGLALVTTMAARSLHLTTRMDILPFSIAWAAAAAVLDAVFLVPFSGWLLYAEWSVWVGYMLIIVIPLLTFKGSKAPARPNPAPRVRV